MPLVGLVPGSSDGFVDHNEVFHTLNMLSAGLSIIGSSMVILAFVLFKQLRRFFARLILYLAISDLWLCTCFLMGYSRPPHNMKCMVQSALGSFFGLASILWTLAIADAVRRVLLARDLCVESKHEVRLHGFAWGFSFLAFLLVFCAGVAGPAGISCWIRNTATGTVVRMITFYIPLWLGIGYSGWVYWNVSSLMARLLDQHQVEGSHEYESSVWEFQKDMDRQRRSLKCLLLLPMVLVFCWTPSTVRRLIDMFFPGFACTPLDYACVIAGPLQGAVNAVIYGITPAVRDALFGRLDHSAQKLKGIQRRLRKLRKGRGQRRSFQRLDEEESLAAGLRSAAHASAAPGIHAESLPPRSMASHAAPPATFSTAHAAPQPAVLGQPSAGLQCDDRAGEGAHASGDDEDEHSASNDSSFSGGRPPSQRSTSLPRVEIRPPAAGPRGESPGEVPPRSRARSSSVELECADVDADADNKNSDTEAACYEVLSEGDPGALASDSRGQSSCSLGLDTPRRGSGDDSCAGTGVEAMAPGG